MGIVVLLQKIGIILVKILPGNILDYLATYIGIVCCRVLRKQRSYIQKNLTHIFHDRVVSDRSIRCLVISTFVNFARAMIDFFRLGSMSKEQFRVECLGIDNLQQALQHKRGCVLITAHIGNWDYAGAYLAAFGVPMSALVEVTDPRMFDLYTKHREYTGMKTYPLAQAGHALLDMIKNNRVLAVLADRDIMNTGIVVDMFDGRRKIPHGLGRIIIKRKVPVVFAYMVLHPDPQRNRYLGVIETPVIFSGCVKTFHDWLVQKMEDLLRTYPDQWFVFHPEWID